MFADLRRATKAVFRRCLALCSVLRVRRERGPRAVIEPPGFRLALAPAGLPQGLLVTADIDAISLQGGVDLFVELARNDVVAKCQFREARQLFIADLEK